jgi:hypothetical protein
MRPYKIPMTNRWVDLDTIQSINEPVFEDHMGNGGYFIVLRWQHAFRDMESKCSFQQEAEVKSVGVRPMLDEDRNPSQLRIIREKVFGPFFTAWTDGLTHIPLKRESR